MKHGERYERTRGPRKSCGFETWSVWHTQRTCPYNLLPFRDQMNPFMSVTGLAPGLRAASWSSRHSQPARPQFGQLPRSTAESQDKREYRIIVAGFLLAENLRSFLEKLRDMAQKQTRSHSSLSSAGGFLYTSYCGSPRVGVKVCRHSHLQIPIILFANA